MFNLLHCNFIMKGATCVCIDLQLDAGVLHDHLINHTNKNNLLVLYLKGGGARL